MMAAAQELSPFDRRRLDEHLSVCESCSEFYRDMALIGGALATSDTETPQAVRTSDSLTIVPRPSSSLTGLNSEIPTVRGERRPAWWGVAAAGIVCFAGGLLTAKHTTQWKAQAPQVSMQSVSRQETALVQSAPQLNSTTKPATEESSISKGHEADLEAKLMSLRHELENSQSALDALRQQHQNAAEATQNLTADLTKLRLENDTQQALIRQIQFQLDQAHNAHAQDLKLVAMRENQIRELTTNVVAGVSEAADARKHNEASQLMEQRNLHVVDVYDNDTKGQRSPSFGRVFYSEGGPMMFVAFDLPTSGHNAKTTYHAWGQTEGSSKNPLHLGTFTEDDALSQRWVLRVTDTQALKQVDAVFITADRGTDVHTPSGSRLLYAYLHQVPNHP